MSSHRIKIAITGGPSGGKTTLIENLKKEYGTKIAIVPEAASILYKGGFPRIKSKSASVHTQRVIFSLQHELEDLIEQEFNSHMIICDRGSLDGIAYWPYSEENFYQVHNTSKNNELKRYHWVIHLETAPREYYDTDNPIRTESFEEAQFLNEKVKKAWEGHPQRIIISQKEDFWAKISITIKILQSIWAGDNYEKVKNLAP